ncbi:MAG: hypothetical protein QNK31_03445 [Porticoccus sp.]|nr:hypothetical protein [Porticoccus sp.]
MPNKSINVAFGWTKKALLFSPIIEALYGRLTVMTESDIEKQKQLAIKIVTSADEGEKEALRIWIERLLNLKASSLSASQKAKQAISLTAESKVLVPTVKMIARETKRLAWDDRSLKGRLGLGCAALGIALFGGQGAGIAALGTAIGVPLWVVFGAGGAFAGVVYEEITGRKPNTKTTYTVIDAEGKDEE